MTRLYSNNFSTTLDGSITDSATSIDVTSATGLPSVGSGDTCLLTIDDGTNIEIVECTAVSSNTLTVVRGQESTSGTAFDDGVTIELRATAGSFIDREGEVEFSDAVTFSGTIDAGGATSLEIPNSATPTVNADGEIALDTTVSDFSHGILKYYGGEEMAVVAVPIAELTSPSDGHVIAYNATNDEFELVAQSGGSTAPAFAAVPSGAQSIANATDTKVSFQTEVFDTNSDFDNSTNYRFTPTVAGKYQINAGVGISSLDPGNQLIIKIYKNGTAYRSHKTFSSVNDSQSTVISDILDMNGSTDYVEIYAYQNDGSARNTYTTEGATFFSGSKIA